MIMRTIYIATYSCSTGKIQVVTEFAGQYSFQIYVDNEAGAFKKVPKRASIDNLCDLLYDKGPGLACVTIAESATAKQRSMVRGFPTNTFDR